MCPVLDDITNRLQNRIVRINYFQLIRGTHQAKQTNEEPAEKVTQNYGQPKTMSDHWVIMCNMYLNLALSILFEATELATTEQQLIKNKVEDKGYCIQAIL